MRSLTAIGDEIKKALADRERDKNNTNTNNKENNNNVRGHWGPVFGSNKKKQKLALVRQTLRRRSVMSFATRRSPRLLSRRRRRYTAPVGSVRRSGVFWVWDVLVLNDKQITIAD